MTAAWEKLFTQAEPAWKDAWSTAGPLHLSSLEALRNFLDLAHIKYCLVKPYCELPDYPLVETRELLPSFESDLREHEKLPGFSLVAFARPLEYFHEIFQFDLLSPLDKNIRADHAAQFMIKNLHVLQSRLARGLHEPLRSQFQKNDASDLSSYPRLLPFLTNMDRGHVLSMHGTHPQDRCFCLSGVYASFPSDLDTEVKRYGLRIGKFVLDDPDSYEQNRNFVLQYLMELYGFPVSSERRTSAALFARRLHKMGERFLIRTLGQSDRVLTTLCGDERSLPYPRVDKIALVRVEDTQDGMTQRLFDGGFFVDEARRVVIFKVRYHQHKYSPDNVLQDRALSVKSQQVIHPLTGESLDCPGLIRDTTNMFLCINDIVRGEYSGRIVYKRNEVVENTDSEEKRLKFLYSWLVKHQRRMIGYSDEYFANIGKVLDSYLLSPEREERFSRQSELLQEVSSRYSYIIQARKVKVLGDLQKHVFMGEHIGYLRMLTETVALLHSLKFEIVNYFDSLVATVIAIGEAMLNDRYLVRAYFEKPEESLTRKGLEIKRNYGKLVALMDEFKSIRKSRTEKAIGVPASIAV